MRVSGLFVLLFLSTIFPCRAAEAQTVDERHVTVGGVTGFASLSDPATTEELRQSGQAGLYLHAEAWKVLDASAQHQILDVFKGTGPAVVELGYNVAPEGYFKNFYKPAFLDKGVVARTALINGLCKDGFVQAKPYIDAARSHGLQRVAVVFAPNSGQYKTSLFSDTIWECERQAILYGQALAVDAPPHVFHMLGQPYRDFVMDEIRWANANRMPTYLIISANGSGAHFFEETREMLDVLHLGHAVPTNFVFETYDIQRHDSANTVGSEGQKDTVLGVALTTINKGLLRP